MGSNASFERDHKVGLVSFILPDNLGLNQLEAQGRAFLEFFPGGKREACCVMSTDQVWIMTILCLPISHRLVKDCFYLGEYDSGFHNVVT